VLLLSFYHDELIKLIQ